ncbi:MAG TPA: 3-deoxy-manno-octulosonate cytidylyltransferase [Chitinophagaceae bacterium]|jgi:3-deoxy-manno-octulosonate cytidylyltransferase (CMP-KDO synthetase)|nr:3-deoxy-manno-octulosonate cytidylyltransferase [Chitinophagaceae bacterium]
MNIVAAIPARYAATRFPGKLMQMLGKKPIIRHVYDNTLATGLFNNVFIVTDSDIIYKEINENGGKVIMSKKGHESGSDRIAEAVAEMNVDVIVNVQGDEPFIKKEPLEKLVQLFNDPGVQVASLMRKISKEEAADPNNVKVVTDESGDALYFSRSIIPYQRDEKINVGYFLHVGVYAYKKDVLMSFTKWPQSSLEKIEKLEQLRYLENGIKIKMTETDYNNIAIDTPEDLERAKSFL